ncbi:MAG: tetratricopeptide repeat protein [Armatimonadota bacterium]|nr:tetratricopeptide repeat protein [Armatimonadota bacterium]
MEDVDAGALRNQAAGLFREGKIAQCIERLNDLLSANPDDDHAYAYLGAAHSQQKEWDQAVSAFERALALKPSCRAHYNLGLALEGGGRLEEAASRFASALAVDSSYKPATDALDRVRQALARLAESGPAEPEGPSLLNADEDEDPNAVSVESLNTSSSPVWSDAQGLDLSGLDARQARQPGGEAMARPPTKEEMDAEREAKALEVQKQMTRSGLIYGTGIGAVWYIALFFFMQLFGFSSLVARFAEGYGFFLLIGILAAIGAGIGAAVGYAVGRTGGGESMGAGIGAAAGLITEPLKTIIAGDATGASILISAAIGVFIGALVGYVIAQLVDLSIGWN